MFTDEIRNIKILTKLFCVSVYVRGLMYLAYSPSVARWHVNANPMLPHTLKPMSTCSSPTGPTDDDRPSVCSPSQLLLEDELVVASFISNGSIP